MAFKNGHIKIIKYLFQDSRVDPTMEEDYGRSFIGLIYLHL
jgi:hypothetical protein